MTIVDNSKEQPRLPIREYFRSNRGKSFALLPANEAVSGHDEFERFVREKLKLKLPEEEIHTTKTGLEEQLKKLGVLKDVAEHSLKRATFDGKLWSLQHDKQPGKYLQKFMTQFARYLESYSGVVEVLKQGGQGYGAAAYSTLSLLLIVAVNKSENDDKVAGALEDLEHSFPRLEILLKVYTTDRFAKLVAEVYKEGILFARSATKYFCSRAERFRWAVGKPPQMGVNLSIQKIQQRLAEVNSEAMVLLHSTAYRIEEQLRSDMQDIGQKYDGLKNQNEDLQKQNEDLKKQNEEIKTKLELMHKEEKDRALGEIRKRQDMLRHYLHVEQNDIHVDIPQFQTSLSKTFGFDKVSPAKTPRRYLPMTPELLQNDLTYDQWKNATGSSILILAGSSPPEALMNRSTHSWLSAGALQVAENLLARHQMFAYYWCHPEDHSGEVNLKDIAFQLIDQIVSRRPQSLADITGDFEILLTKANESTMDGVAFLEPLKAVLRSQEKGTTVWIIVDRFDQCAFRSKRVEMLRQFVSVMTEASCTVKALVTIDPMFWPMEDWKYEKRELLEIQDDSNGLILSKLDWDQPRDPTKW